MKTLYIIILKFNGDEEIKECLRGIRLANVPKGWERKILLVDNTPNKHISYFRENDKEITWIKNKTNLGFAKGVNKGIRYALKKGAEAVLLLNQDVLVNKDFLLFLLKNEKDIVGATIKFRRNERWVYDYGGKVNWKTGETTHIEKFKISNSKFNIDYVSGCCMLIRRLVLEKVGFFDERYFLYFEDVDFCLRAKNAGFKIEVEPKAIVVHRIKEGRKKPLWQRLQIIKSNLIFINQWISFRYRPCAWLLLLGRGVKIISG